VVPAVDVSKREYILLYFGAKWCGPCRRFSPYLGQLYKEMRDDNKRDDFEIIFVSLDASPAEFTDYIKDMPFPAVPFLNEKERNKLCRRYRIASVPALVVLNKAGDVLNKNAVEEAKEETSITKFPWPTKTVLDLLDEIGVVSKRGVALRREHLQKLKGGFALYFGGQWSPPCRSLTPQLMAIYHQLTTPPTPKGAVEFVYVSMDKSAEVSEEVYEDMPWARTPYQHPLESDLKKLLDVTQIPTLITFQPDGTIVNQNARYDACDDLGGDQFPWPPPELSACAELQPSDAVIDALNNRCCFILHLNGSPNAKTQISEFQAAAAAFLSTYSSTPEIFFPERPPNTTNTEPQNSTTVDTRSLPKIAFLTVPENDEDLFSRVVQVVQAQMPSAGKAYVLCVYLPGEGRMKEVLSAELSQTSVVATATEFLKRAVVSDLL